MAIYVLRRKSILTPILNPSYTYAIKPPVKINDRTAPSRKSYRD